MSIRSERTVQKKSAASVYISQHHFRVMVLIIVIWCSRTLFVSRVPSSHIVFIYQNIMDWSKFTATPMGNMNIHTSLGSFGLTRIFALIADMHFVVHQLSSCSIIELNTLTHTYHSFPMNIITLVLKILIHNSFLLLISIVNRIMCLKTQMMCNRKFSNDPKLFSISYQSFVEYVQTQF